MGICISRLPQAGQSDLIMIWEDEDPLTEPGCPHRGVVIEETTIPGYIPLNNYRTKWNPKTESFGIKPQWHTKSHNVAELIEYNDLLDHAESDHAILESLRFKYLEGKRYPRLPDSVIKAVRSEEQAERARLGLSSLEDGTGDFSFLRFFIFLWNRANNKRMASINVRSAKWFKRKLSFLRRKKSQP